MSELGCCRRQSSCDTHVAALLFGPLHEPLFRSLWVAAVVSYTGTWMQNVGAGWLMTSLTMSPLMVGLVQAASSIAVFLVVLPAGAIADVVDRRKLLLLTQLWMVLAAAALGVLTIAGLVTPALLLLFTFLMGFGAVLNDPAWQAITPEIVSRENFAAGIALNSAGFNVARAIGPALGGLVIYAAGSGIAFLLNAVSFFGVIYFLYRWKCAPGRTSLSLKHTFDTMFDGLRHLRGSRDMHAVLVRSAVFSISGSALLALLPLISHPFGSQGFGLLLGVFGVGALIGASYHAVLAPHDVGGCPGRNLDSRLRSDHLCRWALVWLLADVHHPVDCRHRVDPDSRQPQRLRPDHVAAFPCAPALSPCIYWSCRAASPSVRRYGEPLPSEVACSSRCNTPRSDCCSVSWPRFGSVCIPFRSSRTPSAWTRMLGHAGPSSSLDKSMKELSMKMRIAIGCLLVESQLSAHDCNRSGEAGRQADICLGARSPAQRHGKDRGSRCRRHAGRQVRLRSDPGRLQGRAHLRR